MARVVVSGRSRRRSSGARVRASGGVVVRLSPRWALQVAVVHRPDRDDWTFPKGKLEPTESLEACARREVWEETGYHCRLGRYLGATDYVDRRGRPKTVAYWLMDVVAGEFAPSDEVDALRWVDVEVAGRLLSYERDRELLGTVVGSLLPASG